MKSKSQKTVLLLLELNFFFLLELKNLEPVKQTLSDIWSTVKNLSCLGSVTIHQVVENLYWNHKWLLKLRWDSKISHNCQGYNTHWWILFWSHSLSHKLSQRMMKTLISGKLKIFFNIIFKHLEVNSVLAVKRLHHLLADLREQSLSKLWTINLHWVLLWYQVVTEFSLTK